MRVVKRSDMFSFRSYGKNALPLHLFDSRLLARAWPIVIIASAAAVTVVVTSNSQTAIRPALVLWFMFVCPGMAFIRLLRITSIAVEIALAIALSLALATIVTGSLLYAGIPSTVTSLGILSGLSIVGALAQLFLLDAGASYEGEEL